jgi:hypothetical protein
MAERRKTKRVPNEMINKGLEKKRWLILESVIEDTDFTTQFRLLSKTLNLDTDFTDYTDGKEK